MKEICEYCENCAYVFICSLEEPEIDEDTGVCVDYLFSDIMRFFE